MSFAVMLLALVIGVAIEQAAPSSVYTGFAKPPILICVVAYYALNFSPAPLSDQDGRSGQPGGHSTTLMLSAAFIGGILSDSLFALPLGITPVVFAAVGSLLHHYREKVFSGKPVTNIVFGAALGLIMPSAVNILLLVFNQSVLAPWPSLGHRLTGTPYSFQPGLLFCKLVASTAMGAFLFPLIYFLMKRLELLTGVEVLRNSQDDIDSNN